MDSKGATIASLVAAVLGLVLAIGVATAFSACGPKEDGTWMHCHDVQMAIIGCGAAIVVASALAAFLKGRSAKMAFGIISVVLGIVVLALPAVMPLCMVETMRCHAVMVPFARIVAALACVAGIVGVVMVARTGKADMPRYGAL